MGNTRTSLFGAALTRLLLGDGVCANDTASSKSSASVLNAGLPRSERQPLPHGFPVMRFEVRAARRPQKRGDAVRRQVEYYPVAIYADDHCRARKNYGHPNIARSWGASPLVIPGSCYSQLVDEKEVTR